MTTPVTRPPRKSARIIAARPLPNGSLPNAGPRLSSGPMPTAGELLNSHHLAPDDREREGEELVLAAACLELHRVDMHADPPRGSSAEIGHRQRLHVRRLLRRVLLFERTRDDVTRRP